MVVHGGGLPDRATVEGDARLTLWVLALVVDFGAPLVNFWLPGLGQTPMSEWTLRGGHLAERMQLVLIIALGESIIITGTGFSELSGGASTTTAFIVAFLGSVALWWIYFGPRQGRYQGDDAPRPAPHATPTRSGPWQGRPSSWAARRSTWPVTLSSSGWSPGASPGPASRPSPRWRCSASSRRRSAR